MVLAVSTTPLQVGLVVRCGGCRWRSVCRSGRDRHGLVAVEVVTVAVAVAVAVAVVGGVMMMVVSCCRDDVQGI